jgi:hypothetical protein
MNEQQGVPLSLRFNEHKFEVVDLENTDTTADNRIYKVTT